MIRFDIISAIPDLLTSPLSHSIMQRAVDKGLLNVQVHDLRKYGEGHYKQIDDYQYGGGAGMVLTPGPLDAVITKLKDERNYDEVIYMTPEGKRYNQSIANRLSMHRNIIIICGHYKGIDHSFLEFSIMKVVHFSIHIKMDC